MFQAVILVVTNLLVISTLCDQVVNNNDNDNNYDVYPSSCDGLADGYHFLKLMNGDDDEYPLVYARCSNNYMILDYSVDSDISSYFSSWDSWFNHYYGPTNDDRVNWNDWYKPSSITSSKNAHFSFLVSPDCSSCESDQDMNTYFGTESTYWMSGNLFGCYWQVKGSPNFEQDWDTDKCWAYSGSSSYHVGIFEDDYRTEIDDYSVEAATLSSEGSTGTCAHIIYQSSNSEVATTHRDCTNLESSIGTRIKPSIGTGGSYCVCVKPNQQNYFSSQMSQSDKNEKIKILKNVSENKRDGKEKEEVSRKDEEEEAEGEEDVDIKLYQKDFDHGTYRILKSGVYTMMEDIVLDFGSNVDNPNSEGAYWPTEYDSSFYPGAGDLKGPFATGWFAGITIEADNVVLDLNGYKIGQSEMFYFQQRWFSIIEISNQNFIPGQGPFNAGSNPHFSKNIVIKNGKIGPSSHHGIHGNCNENVLIDNIHVFHFETHGIQLNGFKDIEITNTEVGPTSSNVYFNGRYGQGRALISRYREISEIEMLETNGNPSKVLFFGRDKEVSMQDIVVELELELDFALEYSKIARDLSFNGYDVSQNDVQEMIKNKILDDYDDNDEYEYDYEDSYNKAIDTFIDGFGSPNGAAQYGIFLNTYGASIATYNLYSGVQSTGAQLSNIKIHGMTHKMFAVHAIALPGGLISSLNLFIDSESIFSNYDDWENGLKGLHYKGNILTDAAMLSETVSNDFSLLGIQDVGDLIDFSFGKQSWGDMIHNIGSQFNNRVEMQYNADTMAHSGKGTQGLRIDAVKDVYIKNIYIYDNHDFTDAEININGNGDKSPEFTYNMCTSNYGCDENDKTGDGWEEVVVMYSPHIFQNEPMQHGFCGNMNQGININSATNVLIENAYINDLTSKTGAVIGISMWPADEITIKGDIFVNNLNAGYGINSNEFDYGDYPMQSAEVCAVRHYKEYEGLESSVDISEANFDSKCIMGNTGCLGDESLFHMFGNDDLINPSACDTSDNNDNNVVNKIFQASRQQRAKSNSSSTSNHDDWGIVAWVIGAVVMISLSSILYIGVKKPQWLSWNRQFKYELLLP